MAIIVGIVIGAGIYETAPLIARNVAGAGELYGAWVLGGLISLIGAACYAELATRLPKTGGDYVFLTRAYGRRLGFLFAWAEFWVMRPASIGAIAYIFARYADSLFLPAPDTRHFAWLAGAAVIVLTVINVLGVQSGKWTQNLLTSIKVLALLLIAAVGLLCIGCPRLHAAASPSGGNSSFALAMILVLFTYGGWNNLSYVAAEVERPERNILRALMGGILLIAALYLLVNAAFVNVLGLDGFSSSPSAATELLRLAFGEYGAIVIALLICITCLGNINGMIFTGARIYYALGTEHALYRWLGDWNETLDAPVRALTLQGLVTLGLIVAFAASGNAFERLVIFSAPFFWFFFTLVAFALFILRREGLDREGSYRVPLYPLTPILFCASTLLMLWASLSYAIDQRYSEVWWVLFVVICGLLASLRLAPPTERAEQNGAT
jgi:amino acid transporter